MRSFIFRDLFTDPSAANKINFVFPPGMIAIDQAGHVAAGTSTNGLSHKVPGYVDYVDVSVKFFFFSLFCQYFMVML